MKIVRHTPVMYRRPWMRSLYALVLELNFTFKDANLPCGIQWRCSFRRSRFTYSCRDSNSHSLLHNTGNYMTYYIVCPQEWATTKSTVLRATFPSIDDVKRWEDCALAAQNCCDEMTANTSAPPPLGEMHSP